MLPRDRYHRSLAENQARAVRQNPLDRRARHGSLHVGVADRSFPPGGSVRYTRLDRHSVSLHKHADLHPVRRHCRESAPRRTALRSTTSRIDWGASAVAAVSHAAWPQSDRGIECEHTFSWLCRGCRRARSYRCSSSIRRIGPDPHLSFVVEIQTIERDFVGQG